MKMREYQTTIVRDDRIDSLKYWLIVLVIVAHVIMRDEFAGSATCAVLWNWICIFAMPLFIFISGYFSRKKDKKDFWPSIWKLLEPLIIFHVVGLLFTGKTLSIGLILKPWYILWYLLSLIYWRFMLQIIPDKILRHKKIILISTCCISIMAGFLPFDKVLSIQRTLSLMPFFFLGYYMKGRNLYMPNKYKPFFIVFLVVIFAILYFFPHRIEDLLYAYPYKNIYGAAIRMAAFVLAIPMSIAFLNVCYSTLWIARQGRMSMHYFIYHALMVKSIMMLAGKLNVPMSFVTAAIIIIGIIVGLFLILKIPYVKMFTNPSLFFMKSKVG